MLELTTEIVAAHVGNNTVAVTDLPALITDVYKTLVTVGSAPPAAERPRPAVPVKKSVFPDYIICLEDGKEAQDAEAPSEDGVWNDARRVSGTLGTALGLPHGCSELRQAP